MSIYLNRLRILAKNKKNVQSNTAFIKAADYIERLEVELDCLQAIATLHGIDYVLIQEAMKVRLSDSN